MCQKLRLLIFFARPKNQIFRLLRNRLVFSMVKSFELGNVSVGGPAPFYVLGPCVSESEKFLFSIASDLKGICGVLNISWIFNASYDKANRTLVESVRGIGIEA